MTRRRLVVEFGMGTDLQGRDYTKAAVRALRDALSHNSLTIAPALGFEREAMQVHIEIGVAEPEAVDQHALSAVLPYGSATVSVRLGGLDVVRSGGRHHTVIANAAAVVYLEIDDSQLAVAGLSPGASASSHAGTEVRPLASAGGDVHQGGRGAARDAQPGFEMRQIILEMGTGNDLYGEDYTKAGCRAVQDALHHSSLILFRSLGFDHACMQVHVNLGVQQPAAVNTALVAAQVPFGTVTVGVSAGGLTVVDDDQGTTTVIATAALAVSIPVPVSFGPGA